MEVAKHIELLLTEHQWSSRAHLLAFGVGVGSSASLTLLLLLLWLGFGHTAARVRARKAAVAARNIETGRRR